MINQEDRDIRKIKSTIVSEIKTLIKDRFKNSKKEYYDNNLTYQCSLTEKQGGTWKDFHDFFFEICEKYEDRMDFKPPGCYKCIFNGDKGIHFFEDGFVYLLYVEMNSENITNCIYTISISQCKYNERGMKEYEIYLKEENEKSSFFDFDILEISSIIETIEIRANRTIDIYDNGLAIMNYEGNLYYLFNSREDAIKYVNESVEVPYAVQESIYVYGEEIDNPTWEPKNNFKLKDL